MSEYQVARKEIWERKGERDTNEKETERRPRE